MTPPRLLDAFMRWMTSVAQTICAAGDGVRPARCVRLVEEDANWFRLERGPAGSAGDERIRMNDGEIVGSLPAALASALKGSRIELVLSPDRFVFRRLELPGRAAEFLDGIVRAQIDRLTPWAASEAVFGWTPPSAIEKDRMYVTLGATARAVVAPLVQACTRLGPKMIDVCTLVAGSDPRPITIKVLEHRVQEAFGARRMRRGLAVVFIAAAFAAAAAVIAGQWIGADLDAQQRDIARRVSQRRVALHRDGPGTAPAQQLLERRKQQVAASVMVLEALSRTLPDHTYVTELRIEGDRLQVVGITQDAPSLIRLMEQSPHFARATFFAPTTRAPGDSGERFHIEARLKPVFTQT